MKKYLNPQASDDFNRFLEKIPQNVGQKALIAAGISWGVVIALGLFAVMQMQILTDLRSQLLASEAVKPVVPVMTTQAVTPDELKPLLDDFKTIYPDLQVNVNGGNVNVQSHDTSQYPEFREILGHLSNGGVGWKVSVQTMCVGRECKQNSLGANLKIERLKIDKPSS